MPIKGPPAVERALANTIRTYVNAQLDAVWAAWATYDAADGLVVPKVYPTSVFAGYRRMIPEYPAIQVVSQGGTVGDDATMAGTGGWMNLQHEFEIGWIVQGDDVHVMDEQIHRYGVAIWETLMLNPFLDGSLVGTPMVHLRKYGRSDILKHDRSNMLMQAGGWQATVELDESA